MCWMGRFREHSTLSTPNSESEEGITAAICQTVWVEQKNKPGPSGMRTGGEHSCCEQVAVQHQPGSSARPPWGIMAKAAVPGISVGLRPEKRQQAWGSAERAQAPCRVRRGRHGAEGPAWGAEQPPWRWGAGPPLSRPAPAGSSGRRAPRAALWPRRRHLGVDGGGGGAAPPSAAAERGGNGGAARLRPLAAVARAPLLCSRWVREAGGGAPRAGGKWERGRRCGAEVAGKAAPATFGLAIKWRRAGGRSGSGVGGVFLGEKRGAGTARPGPVRSRRRLLAGPRRKRLAHAAAGPERNGRSPGGAGWRRLLHLGGKERRGQAGCARSPSPSWPSWHRELLRDGTTDCTSGPGPAPGVAGAGQRPWGSRNPTEPNRNRSGLRRVGLKLPCLGEVLVFSGQRRGSPIGELNTRSWT